MDETALRALIDSLGANLSSLDWWMRFWTVLVIFGCAGELVFVIWAHLDERTEWSKARANGFLSFPEKPSLIKLVLEVLSVVFVVAGISGELYIDRRSGDLQTQLRDANGKLVLLFEQEAGTAKQSAKDAQESARIARSDANAAGLKADGAKTTADNAQVKAEAVGMAADALTTKLAGTSTQVEATEAKRKSLQSALHDLAICNAPRVIRDWYVDGRSYVDPLRPFKGYSFLIEYVPEPEAARAATSIQSSLINAGWIFVTAVPLSGIRDGVRVESYSGFVEGGDVDKHVEASVYQRKSRDAARLLVGFLHDNHWEASQHTEPFLETDIPPKGIKIQVGLYPASSALPTEEEIQIRKQAVNLFKSGSAAALAAAAGDNQPCRPLADFDSKP